MGAIGRVKQFFFGDKRTSRLSKNIIYSFFIKGYAIIIQFAMVPLTLDYLDKFHYGIWLVLSSIINWFSYFDIGIGHGLRNRLSEALANDNVPLARIFTSTSYALVTMIFSGFIFIFVIINPLLNWSDILNAPPELNDELSEVVLFVYIFFSIRFILSLITPIIFAKQDPALNSFIGPLGSTLSLLAIIILAGFVSGSLFWIAIIFSSAPLLVMGIFSFVLFKNRYKDVVPSIKYVDFSYSTKLFKLGVGFFVIQMAQLVLFSSANMILTQLFGPNEVTVYNIAYRYFTIPIMVSSIVTGSYWSAFTEAIVKKDIHWIKKGIRRLNYISFILFVGLILSLLLADQLIFLWVGSSIVVSLSMKLALTGYVGIHLISSPYVIFVNGSSKIRMALYIALVSIIITIPLAILFSNTLNMGPTGVVIAIICSTLPSAIVWRVQYHLLINDKAKGVWNK